MSREKGRVLRIEKTSIHDGDGLRTVVFLKGCPLRCRWCSTPESQKMDIEYGYGKDMTVDEVVREVCKDEIFFFYSGGGVTISGGEVLMQPDFAGEILRECMERGIETAVETSLYADFAVIRKLLPYLNAMYIDFKLSDEAAHRFYTGVSNAKIKENLRRTDEVFTGDLHIRIPAVPGVNLSRQNMEDTARFLSNLHQVRDLELLPYHRLGMETYRKLKRPYSLKDVEPPSMEEMRAAAADIHRILPDIPVKIKGEPADPGGFSDKKIEKN